MTNIWLRAAMALAGRWVALSTIGLPREVSERRRSELESDVWETMHARSSDGSPVALMEVVDRLVRGVPADIAWWFDAWRLGRRADGDAASSAQVFDRGPLTPFGRAAFQLLASVAIVGAVIQVARQLLRVGDFQAAVPLESPVLVAVVVGIYCVPPVTALLACAVAVPLVLKAEHLPEARSLAFFLAFMSLFWATVFSFFYFLPSSEAGQLNFGWSFGPGASAWAYTWLVLAIVAFLRFSALFPRPLNASDTQASRAPAPLQALQRLALLPVFVWSAAAALILIMVAPAVGRPWTPPGAPIDIAWTPLWVLAIARMVIGYAIVPILLMALGVVNLCRGARSANGRERRRTLWVFAGFSSAFWMVTISIAAFFLQDVLPEPAFLLLAQVLLAPLVIVVCLAVAVFYRGDLDPVLVLRRGAVYGAIGVLFVAVLAVAESLASDALVERLGIPSLMGDALLAAAVALLMVPAKRVLAQSMERASAARVAGLERASF
jgi:hypothetical protein